MKSKRTNPEVPIAFPLSPLHLSSSPSESHAHLRATLASFLRPAIILRARHVDRRPKTGLDDLGTIRQDFGRDDVVDLCKAGQGGPFHGAQSPSSIRGDEHTCEDILEGGLDV